LRVVDADAEERRDILRISEDELLKPTRTMAQTCLLVGLSGEILTDVVLEDWHEHNTHRLRLAATFEMIHAAWRRSYTINFSEDYVRSHCQVLPFMGGFPEGHPFRDDRNCKHLSSLGFYL
jgi:hypothetical protein